MGRLVLSCFLLAQTLSLVAYGDAGRVEAFSCDRQGNGDVQLSGIALREGEAIRIYDGKKVIPAQLIHYQGGGGVCLALKAGSDLGEVDRTRVLETSLLCGLTNPGAMNEASAGASGPGLAIRFAQPVLNRSGIDAVFFELHKGSGAGDPFHVAPLTEAEGRHGRTVNRYDIPPSHPSAVGLDPVDLYKIAKPMTSLQEFLEAPLASFSKSEGNFSVIATGIDLSDLGYAPEEAVEGLVFRAVAGKSGFDPLAIVGLPEAIPENLLEKLPAPKPREAGPLLQEALAGPLVGCEEIIFAQRVSGRDHWYGNFGHYCESDSKYSEVALKIEGDMRYTYGDGGRLCRLNLRSGEVRVLLEDPLGGIRDPHLHYEGEKILFSYRKGGAKSFHLYEISIEGDNLTQLTDGPDNDIEPIYTPEGSIIFCSSRCHRYVPCWRTQVATLYRCDADGKNIRMLSNNAEQENTPWILPDGRVLYMRWEYVDRNQLLYHHLWTVNPDGSAVMVYFGNQHNGLVMIDAKPIPHTKKVVASFSPDHGRPEHMGKISIVDPRRGPDDMSMVQTLSDKHYRDPYPLSEELFLVADDAGIYLLTAEGKSERIYSSPSPSAISSFHEPRPLRARKREAIIPDRNALSEPNGTLFLSDVYEGRNMAGIERGSIKKLLILEQLPKPANFSGGQEPLTIGGTFTLQRILGTVPVEEDGSAYMSIPALRSVFFLALDENDLAVKRMQSFVTVQPGESTSCVGCHEARTQAPPAKSSNTLLAATRKPSAVEPFTGFPDVLDFPRDIQPIFDRHCLACHNHDQTEGDINLSGDHTPYFSTAYWTVVSKGLAIDGRNKYGNQSPRALGSYVSPLMQYLDASHYDVALSTEEVAAIRLWIDSGATYSGSYAALGSGMFPVDFPDVTILRRCGSCHQSDEKPYRNVKEGAINYQFGKEGPPQPLLDDLDDIILIRHLAYFQYGEAPLHQALCNLDAPARSLFLRAPLAKEAGGLQRCGQAVFKDTKDAAYQEILGAIESAAQALREKKRFDMPGFRPNRYYTREMQFFGILPKDLDPETPIDVYETDQRYWKSLVHQP